MTTHSQSTSRLNLGKKQEEAVEKKEELEATIVDPIFNSAVEEKKEEILDKVDEIVETVEDTRAPTNELGLFVPSFQGIRLTQVIRKNGTKWLPNQAGYFVPSNMEEAEYVEYYVRIGRMVQVDE